MNDKDSKIHLQCSYLSTAGVHKSGDVYKSSGAQNKPPRGVASRQNFRLHWEGGEGGGGGERGVQFIG